MPVARLIIATLATLLSISANVVAEDCLHKDGESADQRARRGPQSGTFSRSIQRRRAYRQIEARMPRSASCLASRACL
jgi:hypothetical protein